MHTGTYISGAGHILLIGWAIFGGTFKTEPLPFEVQEVTVISTDAFDALQTAEETPDVQVEPVALPVTDVEEIAPEIATAPTPELDRAAPPPPAPAAPDEPALDVAPAPPPEEVAALLPPSTRPKPRPSERIANDPVAPPEPDAAPDPLEQVAVVPDDGETEQPQEPQEATAPEEAAPEIVTEAEEPAGAPLRTPRPAARPERSEVETAETPSSETDDLGSAIANAVAAAQVNDTPRPPAGPPLTSGERDALRVAVSSCWNVGSLSTAALQTTVVVSVDMQQDARPVNASIRMISFSGGPEAAANQAFEAARRAIIRCGARGYQLPSEKYDHWREIEMTFNPEKMRIR